MKKFINIFIIISCSLSIIYFIIKRDYSGATFFLLLMHTQKKKYDNEH